MLFDPRAWRYRDYVVHAFNTDKPYDRFLSEQLAGDELDPDDPELRVAVGFLRMGTYEYNQRDVCGQWADILNDITDVTGEVFLGLSIGCARCHDHKFDPILQRDYYRLQAFFTPLLPRERPEYCHARTNGLPFEQSRLHGSKPLRRFFVRSVRSSNLIATKVPVRRWPNSRRKFRPSCTSRKRNGRPSRNRIETLAFRAGKSPGDRARWRGAGTDQRAGHRNGWDKLKGGLESRSTPLNGCRSCAGRC